MGRLIDLGGASLQERRIGALPIVNAFMDRLGLQGLLDDYVVRDPRASLAPSASLLVLLRSLVVERAPVYKIAEWVAGRPEALLGLEPGQSGALNDDRLGRALDALFKADRASMLTRLMTKAIEEFAICLDELHNDATTLHMQGEYSSSTGDSPRAARVRFGHAKERPDLAQLIYLLTVSSDGYVPITYRLADGNTSEDPTHIETWESCCVLAGRRGFLYVSDAKLCNRTAMGHIDKNHGRFLRRHRYPDATALLVLADCGGSNGARSRAWKHGLQHRLADSYGLSVTVCVTTRVAPPSTTPSSTGCSPRSPRTGRAGRSPTTRPSSTTSPPPAPRPACASTPTEYTTGVKISDKEMKDLSIRHHDIQPNRNYTVSPK